MKPSYLSAIITSICLVLAVEAYGANATFDVTEGTLNRIADRIGVLSEQGEATPQNSFEQDPFFEICESIGSIDCPSLSPDRPTLALSSGLIRLVMCRDFGGGIFVLPTGESVTWQWWITDASFDLKSSGMTFTATVTTRVDGNDDVTTRTVGAEVKYIGAMNRLMIDIDDFKVFLSHPDGSLGVSVDVASFFSISIPIHPQSFSVPLPGGGTRSVTGRITSASTNYYNGSIRVNLNVGF